MSRPEAAEAEVPRQQSSSRIEADHAIITPSDNASYQAATERTRLACGGGGSERNPTLDALSRPSMSDSNITSGMRSEATNEANRVNSAFNSAGDLARATPQQLENLNNVLDKPNMRFGVKMDGMPEYRDPNGPHVRCPSALPSVTFPPPAMEGNYKSIDGKLHIINSKGGYTPFDSVLERLRTGPRART